MAVDLRLVMAVAQLRVTDKAGTYLCEVWALVFEGSVLTYNPARDEVEWVPTHGLANDLTWAAERSAMALANYMPCAAQEAVWIARLGSCQLVSWPIESSTSEEEGGEEEEEEEPEGELKWGEEDAELKQDEEDVELERDGEDVKPKWCEEDEEGEWDPSRQWHSQDWEEVMGEHERLAYDDSWLDSNVTVGGHFPRHLTPHELGSPMEAAVEVHTWESEVEDL